jgi:hypothetical protein
LLIDILKHLKNFSSPLQDQQNQDLPPSRPNSSWYRAPARLRPAAQCHFSQTLQPRRIYLRLAIDKPAPPHALPAHPRWQNHLL